MEQNRSPNSQTPQCFIMSLALDQYEEVVQSSTTGIIAFQSVMSCDGFRMHRKHEKTVAGCAIKW